MLLSFEHTVSALTYSLLEDLPAGEDSRRSALCNRVVRFVLAQQRRMPDYLRLPLTGLTLALDAWTLPFTGRPFHRLSPERRRRQIQAWKRSRLGARRDLIKFYQNLATLGWYAEAYDSVL